MLVVLVTSSVVVAKALLAVLLASLVVVKSVLARAGRVGRSGLSRISPEPSKRNQMPSTWASSVNCKDQGTQLTCPLRMWSCPLVLLFAASGIATVVGSTVGTRPTASDLSIGVVMVPDRSKRLNRA